MTAVADTHLPDGLAELLTVIAGALDVPIDAGHRGRHHDLLRNRTLLIRGYLASLLENASTSRLTLRGQADGIRQMIARYPVTYTTYQREEDTGGEDRE